MKTFIAFWMFIATVAAFGATAHAQSSAPSAEAKIANQALEKSKDPSNPGLAWTVLYKGSEVSGDRLDCAFEDGPESAGSVYSYCCASSSSSPATPQCSNIHADDVAVFGASESCVYNGKAGAGIEYTCRK